MFRVSRGVGVRIYQFMSVLLAMALIGSVAAQGGAEGAAGALEEETAVETAVPALFAVGLSGGFPSYQTVALSASLQAQFVGVQLKGSWTAAGPYVGGQLRIYPPVPLPLPLYLGVGGGFYGPNASYHAVLGSHVPLGKNLRLDVEAGAANVPLLAERRWAPHVALGVSYAFPVELTPGATAPEGAAHAESGAASACTTPTEPDRSLIGAAVKSTIDDWIASARATYGSVYADLRYSYTTSTSGSGANATVAVSYRGSVREILTGVRHSASGTARATFRWNGCGWSNTGVEY